MNRLDYIDNESDLIFAWSTISPRDRHRISRHLQLPRSEKEGRFSIGVDRYSFLHYRFQQYLESHSARWRDLLCQFFESRDPLIDDFASLEPYSLLEETLNYGFIYSYLDVEKQIRFWMPPTFRAMLRHPRIDSLRVGGNVDLGQFERSGRRLVLQDPSSQPETTEGLEVAAVFAFLRELLRLYGRVQVSEWQAAIQSRFGVELSRQWMQAIVGHLLWSYPDFAHDGDLIYLASLERYRTYLELVDLSGGEVREIPERQDEIPDYLLYDPNETAAAVLTRFMRSYPQLLNYQYQRSSFELNLSNHFLSPSFRFEMSLCTWMNRLVLALQTQARPFDLVLSRFVNHEGMYFQNSDIRARWITAVRNFQRNLPAWYLKGQAPASLWPEL